VQTEQTSESPLSVSFFAKYSLYLVFRRVNRRRPSLSRSGAPCAMSRGTSRADDGFVSILTLYHRSRPKRSVSVGRGNSPGSYGNGTANVKPKSIRCTAAAYCARGRVRRAFRARSRGRGEARGTRSSRGASGWPRMYLCTYVRRHYRGPAAFPVIVRGRCSRDGTRGFLPPPPPPSPPPMMRAGFGTSSHD